MMRTGSCFQAVQSIGANLTGSIKADRILCHRSVIINRFWNTNHFNTGIAAIIAYNIHTAVTADNHHGIKPQFINALTETT